MKKTMIKGIASLAICSVMGISLAACGGGSANDPAQKGSSDGTKPITLRFSWWGNDTRHQATLKAIDAYTKLHPNVKIEAEYTGFDGFYNKLLTQFAGSTAPDLFQFTYEWDNDMYDFLLDLKQSKSLDTSGYDPSVISNFATFKDKMIMAPAGATATSLFYNQAFFQKYGIPENTEWTWDNLLEIGKKVHAQDPNAYLMTADVDVIYKLILQPYVAQITGNNWINDDYTPAFDKAALTKGLAYLSELYKNGVLEPFGDSSAFVGKMEQNPKWIKGQVGILFDYISAFDKYKQSVPDGKLGVAAYPMAPNALQSGNPIAAGTGFAVNKTSPNAEEAVKFINWLVNDKDAALILGAQRGIPATSTARKALEDAKQLDPNITKGLDLAGKQKSVAPNVISINADLAQIAKDTLQKLIYQKETPEQATDDILKAYGSKLAALKK